MLSVYKYPFEVTGNVSIQMPMGAKILKFGLQGQVPTLWVLVDPNQTLGKNRTFRLVPTGHKLNLNEEDVSFIDTVQIATPGGELVFHLFEILVDKKY